MSSRECQNELDWSALCYAAGELSLAEAEAFEQLLAEDQPAREALARAVELTQAVAVAESVTQVTVTPVTLTPVTILRTESSRVASSQDGRSRWGRRLAWMAVGSAASLLVAILVSGSGAGARLAGWWRGAPATVSPVTLSPETRELAAAWSETRQELSAASDALLWYPEHLNAAAGQQIEQADGDPDESSDEAYVAAAPSWMTAAVRSSAGLSVDGDTIDGDATPFDGESQEN